MCACAPRLVLGLVGAVCRPYLRVRLRVQHMDNLQICARARLNTRKNIFCFINMIYLKSDFRVKMTVQLTVC